MRHPAIIMTAFLFMLRPAAADEVDVVVQAGHAGRPNSCEPLHVKHCNLGARFGMQREKDWTPIVAGAAIAALRHDGFTVRPRPADWAGHDRARAAVFLHFDGSANPCESGASVGFPKTTNLAFVHDWEHFYRKIFPYTFVGENISPNERDYYAYRRVWTPGRALLIEFGEMTCGVQERWLEPRLHELGLDVARFISAELRP